MIKKYYIVRCHSAGVFFGEIKSQKGLEIELTNSRKIWYWDGAFTLDALAKNGTKKPENCKFSEFVKYRKINDSMVEVIECTQVGAKSITGVIAHE